MNKNTLRQKLRDQRSAISSEQQHSAALSVKQFLTQSDDYQQATHIAFYVACNGELDLHPSLLQALEDNKACYLPVVSPNRQLRFRRYTPDSPMQNNRFGITEPDNSCAEIAANRLDLVLTPLVAFDTHFNRLGMGGGFYDSTFRRAPQALGKRDRRAPVLFGAAHDFQKVDHLEREAWDVALDGVVTESGLLLR